MNKSYLSPEKKIFTLEEAVKWRDWLRKKGIMLAFTNGCFDILHRGHIEYLNNARRMAKALIVAINSDRSVKSLKDPSRPIFSEKDRAYAIAALGCVDAVLIFNSRRCTKLIEALKPDIYVKGGDYTLTTMDKGERKALEACGAIIKFIPFVKGYSTTNVIEKIKQLCG